MWLRSRAYSIAHGIGLTALLQNKNTDRSVFTYYSELRGHVSATSQEAADAARATRGRRQTYVTSSTRWPPRRWEKQTALSGDGLSTLSVRQTDAFTMVAWPATPRRRQSSDK